jgi:hypothetical protein
MPYVDLGIPRMGEASDDNGAPAALAFNVFTVGSAIWSCELPGDLAALAFVLPSITVLVSFAAAFGLALPTTAFFVVCFFFALFVCATASARKQNEQSPINTILFIQTDLWHRICCKGVAIFMDELLCNHDANKQVQYFIALEERKNMKTIKVPFNGKGRKVQYKVETIDMSMTPVGFLNAYAVFIDDPELQPIIGEHFTILHNPAVSVMPLYEIKVSGNIDESNLKKAIAQQVMNNPTE